MPSIQKMINDLLDFDEEDVLRQWDIDFIDSVQKQYEEKHHLTAPQVTQLYRVYNKI